MATDLARLTVAFEAQTAKYERGLARMDNRLKRFERRQKRGIASLKADFRTLGTVFGGIFAAKSLKSIADAGISLDRMQRSLRAATGSTSQAASEFQFVRSEAERLGLDLETAGEAYTRLAAAARGTSLEGEKTREIFTAVSEASRVLGLSTEKTTSALTAIEQVISKGKLTAEELRKQLGNALPGAVQVMARALNVGTGELDKMLSQGKIGIEVLSDFAGELREIYGPEVQAAASDAQAQFARFSNSLLELKGAIAQSGLLAAMSDLAKFAREFAIGIGAAFFNASPEAFGKELLDARDKAQALREQIDHMVDDLNMDRASAEVVQLEEDLLKVESTIVELRQKSIDAMTTVARSIDDAGGATTAADDKFRAFIKQFETAPQKVERLLAQLEGFKDVDYFIERPEEYNRILKEIKASLGFLEGDLIAEISIESDADRILRPEVREDVEELQRTTDKFFAEMIRNTQQSRKAWEDLGLTFTSAFEDAISSGKSLSDILKGLIQDLIRFAARKLILENILNAFGNGSSSLGGDTSGGTGGFPGFTGRASGGPVSSGGLFVVGEKGPEIFVPKVDGNIIPNHDLAKTGSDPEASADILSMLGFGQPGSAPDVSADVLAKLDVASLDKMVDFSGLEFRASGGPVSSGDLFVVGESGPELFVPRVDGDIIPNHDLRKVSGGGVVNNYHFEAGADVATIQTSIIPLLERTQQSTMAQVHDERRRGLL